MSTLLIIVAVLAYVIPLGLAYRSTLNTRRENDLRRKEHHEAMEAINELREKWEQLKSDIHQENGEVLNKIQQLTDKIASIPSISAEDLAEINTITTEMGAASERVKGFVTADAPNETPAEEPAEEPAAEPTGTEG